VAAVDTTGAGDVVCGVIAAGLAQGLELAAALRWAVAAAALKVTRQGAFAGLPTVSELERLRP
jgi:ribokinase